MRILDILISNNTGLNTRAYDSDGIQIFLQETDYIRQGPIAELSVSYAFNASDKKVRENRKTFGDEQF